MAPSVTLQQLPGEYAVCLLPPTSAVPDWVRGASPAPDFVNISYCEDELSIVCPAKKLPAQRPDNLQSETGWSAFKLEGSFAFDETGIVLSVIRPLSENGLGIFVVSTFHRDYLLVKTKDLASAMSHLLSAGHQIIPLENS